MVIAMSMKTGENIMATVNQDTFKWLLGIYSTPTEMVPIKSISDKLKEQKERHKKTQEEYKAEMEKWKSMPPEEREKLKRKSHLILICLAIIIICVIYLIVK